MWQPYEEANPLRLVQEGTLYYKFDYSCILCRRDRPREDIVWVIQRYRVKPGRENEAMLVDPSPPMWTCELCYPGHHGMWMKRKVPTLTTNHGGEGKEGLLVDCRTPSPCRTIPAWLATVNDKLEDFIEQSDLSDRFAALSDDDHSSDPSGETLIDPRPASDRELR
ncbi:hypothetical protein IFR05_015526 [Cadophora sp. M221]|nr:hypothetical protein IFR05_015526 [Cadophora sp. M221]